MSILLVVVPLALMCAGAAILSTRNNIKTSAAGER